MKCYESYKRKQPKPKNHIRKLKKLAEKESVDGKTLPLKDIYQLIPKTEVKILRRAWRYYFLHNVYPENKRRFPLPAAFT